ncbi:hypothetical protein N8I77_008017 [Diaporthe amygdali]|uniref:2EXR domain-containing protein n=1 Tax=Phomopsis amygdali TaxID=1214568 RepID=A0AAD9SEH6_PHOAM|nr:hypothetical protein N8I77_008017 [Diaporthe amygdali]
MVNFEDLPVEMRSQIWAASLSNADMQGIYFFDPEDFGLDEHGEGSHADSDWEVEREVIVAFPTIMHLCRESREYAKSHLSLREDTFKGIDVPCRPYRPETDIFFVPHQHFDSFVTAVRTAQDDEYLGKLQEGKKAFCREIANLAFSSRILADEDAGMLAYFVTEMTALRHLFFVFGNTDTLDLSRPLALADLKTDKAELVHGKPRTKVHVEETLDGFMNEASLWEISDEATAPWDEYTGAWLFDMVAKRMDQVRGLI